MAPIKDYQIEKKEERQKLTPTGDVVTVYRIWATSKGGTYFHVEVPEKDLDKADQLLSARAKQLDAI